MVPLSLCVQVFKCSLKGYVFAEKEVPVRYADDADRALKIKELQVLRKLDHPNICAFLGFQHRDDEARGRKGRVRPTQHPSLFKALARLGPLADACAVWYGQCCVSSWRWRTRRWTRTC